MLAILNPLSRQAQRAGPLLAWLRSAFGADLHVVLNPVHELQKPPLDAYYRLVLPDPSASGTVCFSQTPLPAQTPEMGCLVLTPVHGVMKLAAHGPPRNTAWCCQIPLHQVQCGGTGPHFHSVLEPLSGLGAVTDGVPGREPRARAAEAPPGRVSLPGASGAL